MYYAIYVLRPPYLLSYQPEILLCLGTDSIFAANFYKNMYWHSPIWSYILLHLNSLFKHCSGYISLFIVFCHLKAVLFKRIKSILNPIWLWNLKISHENISSLFTNYTGARPQNLTEYWVKPRRKLALLSQ